MPSVQIIAVTTAEIGASGPIKKIYAVGLETAALALDEIEKRLKPGETANWLDTRKPQPGSRRSPPDLASVCRLSGKRASAFRYPQGKAMGGRNPSTRQRFRVQPLEPSMTDQPKSSADPARKRLLVGGADAGRSLQPDDISPAAVCLASDAAAMAAGANYEVTGGDSAKDI